MYKKVCPFCGWLNYSFEDGIETCMRCNEDISGVQSEVDEI